MKQISIAVMAVLAVTAFDLGAAPARDVRVFVDGAECRGLKAMGKAVARPAGEATLFTADGLQTLSEVSEACRKSHDSRSSLNTGAATDSPPILCSY